MSTSRLPRLFSHLIQQASLPGIDVCISPSKLKPGVYPVDGVLGINPGRGGGAVGLASFYALVVEDSGDGDARCAHHVGERCRVEVVKV
jgi:hypothetical protein